MKTNYTLKVEKDDMKVSFTGDDSYFKKWDNIRLKLVAISLDKEMYKPGCIIAKILVDKPDKSHVTNEELLKVINNLKDVRASLYVDKNDTAAAVAEGYFIFQIKPRISMGTTRHTILELSMYSPDKYLDMKKFSKCYTAKKLGSDVFKEAVDTLVKKNYLASAAKGDYKNQQHLLYELPTSITVDAKIQTALIGNSLEAILPYMVQYNETQHSFISRMANRCGEFFYYEDGILHLGLDLKNSDIKSTKGMKPRTNDKIAAIDVNSIDVSTKTDKTTKTTYIAKANTLLDSEVKEIEYMGFNHEEDTLTYGSEYTVKNSMYTSDQDVAAYDGPAEEDVASYPTEATVKGPFPELDKFSFWTSNIYVYLQKESLLELGSYFAAQLGLTTLANFLSNNNTKDKYTEKYVKSYNTKAESKTDSCIYPFAASNMRLTRLFYSGNYRCSLKAEHNAIHVDLCDDCTRVVKLGDIFNILNCEYVVTRVHSQSSVNTSDNISDVTYWFEAVPALKTTLDKGAVKKEAEKKETEKTDTEKKEAAAKDGGKGSTQQVLPKDGEKKEPAKTEKDKSTDTTTKEEVYGYYPAPLHDNRKRTATAQRAFVTENKDPLNLGRVRIKYPWQTSSDEASPYVRVTQPMASSRGAIRFLPQVGDEVMVGYEYDDVERPFMIGAVASATTNGASSMTGNNAVIRSHNGQKIIFNNPEDGKTFVKSFFPTLIPLAKFVPAAELPKIENTETLGGSMQLTDEHGVYNVELSTERRRIRIRSMLGNVSIDALTGITIQAPNGDISIKGKNISIDASDKLSISSGGNIGKQALYRKIADDNDNMRYRAAQYGSWFISDVLGQATTDVQLKGLLTLIDMTVVRTIIDGLIKPINGTLLIKSKRDVRIEAGNGKTNPPVLYRKKDVNHGTSDASEYEFIAKKTAANNILKSAAQWYDAYSRFKSLIPAINPRNQNPLIRSEIMGILESSQQEAQRKELNNFHVDYYGQDKKKITMAEITGAVHKKFLDYGTVEDVKAYLDDITLGVLIDGNIYRGEKGFKEKVIALYKDMQSLKKIRMQDTNVPFLYHIDNSGYLTKAECGNLLVQTYDKAQAEASITHKKRLFIYYLIQEFKSHDLVSIGPSVGLLKSAVDFVNGKVAAELDTSTAVCDDNDKWTKFIDSVNTGTSKYGIMKDIGEFAGMDYFGDILANTAKIWTPSRDGQIFFSDSNTKKSTVNLVSSPDKHRAELSSRSNDIIDDTKAQLKKITD